MSDLPDGIQPGWEYRPADIEAVLESLPYPTWGTTPAAAISFADIPAEGRGDKIIAQAIGSFPETNQGSVGSCVSWGTTTACLMTASFEVVVGKQSETPKLMSPEVVYGGSRVQVGRGGIRGDGSVGAWAAKWCREYGLLPREKFGQYDLTVYSQDRCRQWGKSGVPDELVTLAREHPMGEVTKITTYEDACVALSQGYGIAVCSNVGFGMRRDDAGFCYRRGSWAHCMAFLAYRKGGKNPGLLVNNSWGFSSTTGPTPDDIPKSSWWVTPETAESMLRQGDSFAFGLFTGFPARKLDWSF